MLLALLYRKRYFINLPAKNIHHQESFTVSLMSWYLIRFFSIHLKQNCRDLCLFSA